VQATYPVRGGAIGRLQPPRKLDTVARIEADDGHPEILLLGLLWLLCVHYKADRCSGQLIRNIDNRDSFDCTTMAAYTGSVKDWTVHMVCDICGKGAARIRLVTRSYGRGAELLVIENVPIVSCPDCGESYLTAATLHEVERIKRDRAQLATERNVAVAVFG